MEKSKKKQKKSFQFLLEKSIEKVHYESYEEWTQNFALNINDIWNESSARDLDPSKYTNYKNKKHSAIVIGRGPSLFKHKHLELLAKSNFKGTIICTDGSLISTLKAGVTPKKFPKFFVLTIDPYIWIKKHYDDPIVDKYGKKINGIFPTIVSPLVVKRARKAGIKIHWLHLLFDYNQGKTSFNKISALMVRAKNHSSGLPAIQTGGNVGTSAWFVAWQIFHCGNVALIGINHGWAEDDPLEKIFSDTAYANAISTKKQKSLMKRVYHPQFKTYCFLDPVFQFYSMAFREFISRSPSWLRTINATEGGSIFGKKVTCMKFNSFLTKYKS